MAKQAKRSYRKFDAAKKKKIIAEYRAAKYGTGGKVLKKYGVYGTQVYRWEQQLKKSA